jgi:hypothetical protein
MMIEVERPPEEVARALGLAPGSPSKRRKSGPSCEECFFHRRMLCELITGQLALAGQEILSHLSVVVSFGILVLEGFEGNGTTVDLHPFRVPGWRPIGIVHIAVLVDPTVHLGTGRQ